MFSCSRLLKVVVWLFCFIRTGDLESAASGTWHLCNYLADSKDISFSIDVNDYFDEYSRHMEDGHFSGCRELSS